MIVAPYRCDGHPDHDTLGSSRRRPPTAGGHGLLEYPIWYWQWATPGHPEWRRWVRLPLGTAEQRAKQEALRTHASQLEPLSGRPGDEVLLADHFLVHF